MKTLITFPSGRMADERGIWMRSISLLCLRNGTQFLFFRYAFEYFEISISMFLSYAYTRTRTCARVPPLSLALFPYCWPGLLAGRQEYWWKRNSFQDHGHCNG